MNIKKSIITLSLIFKICFVYSQSFTHKFCGYSKEYVLAANTFSVTNAVSNIGRSQLQKNIQSSPYMNCGRFRFIFNDILNNTGVGFDTQEGAEWAECLFNVGAYIQNVYNIPSGDGSFIEIEIQNSWSATNLPPDPNNLAAASPLYTSASFLANQPGFYGGNMYDHMTTGIDPDPTHFDAVVTFNSLIDFFACYESSSCSGHDFTSVALHELTHAMGWASLIEEDQGTFLPTGFMGSNRYSIYDREFLYAGNILTGPLTKLIDNTSVSVSAGLPSHVLTQGNLWYTEQLALSATDNQNDKVNYGPNSYNLTNAPNTISHFFHNQMSFLAGTYKSPQFIKDVVMRPAFDLGMICREYSTTELRYLNQMGYVFNTAFLSQSSINTQHTNNTILLNRHPYTSRLLYNNWEVVSMVNGFPSMSYYALGGMDEVSRTPADAQINNCQTYTLDFSAHSNEFRDADNDHLFVFPGSLYNIRGCGLNGNNHDLLTLTNTALGSVITYTPRADFIGRAQFGFHLYDGREKGAFVVWTIDITSCSSTNANKIVNGNFEEGEEVQTMTSPVIDNHVAINYYLNKKYPYASQVNVDGMVYQNGTTVMVRDAWGCNASSTGLNHWHNSLRSFENGTGPNADVSQFGNRYLKFVDFNDTYFRLNGPVSKCKKYVLEFDYNQQTAKNITIGFTNQPDYHKQTSQLDNPVSFTLPATAGNWAHFSIPVNYCSETQNNWFILSNPEADGGLHIDNLSLTEDNTPNVFSLTAIPAQTICPSVSAVISAQPNSPFCSVTYTWLPGNAHTETISISPTANTTYTVLANDGCSSYSATAAVFIGQEPSISVSASQTVCSGNSATLTAQNTNTSAVTSYTWMPGNYYGQSITVSPANTTNYTVQASDNSGCTSIGISTTTVQVLPPLAISVFGPTSLCSGATATLTAQGASSYTWTSIPNIISPIQSHDPVIVFTPLSSVTVSVLGNEVNACPGTTTLPISVLSQEQCACAILTPTVQWQKTFGGTSYDNATSVKATNDGGYILSGYTGSNDIDVTSNHGNSDYWIIKLDGLGAVQWQKTFGGLGREESFDIQQTMDNGYVIIGYAGWDDVDVTGNHGGDDVWVVKTDENGVLMWQKSLGGSGDERAESIAQTTDGGYIIGGYSMSSNMDVSGNHGNVDFWIVKLDVNGNLSWQKSLGGSGIDRAKSVAQTNDGGYIVAGYTFSNDGDVTLNNGGCDYWIVKLTDNGTIQWQKSYGGTAYDAASSIRQTTDGGYILGGSSKSADGDITGHHGANNGGFDYWVTKLNAAGSIAWQKSYGTFADDELYSVRETADRGYIITGFSESINGDVTYNHGSFDAWTLKISATGIIEWQKSLGGSYNDHGFFIEQTADGNYVLAGVSFSGDFDLINNGGSDYWIVRLECNNIATNIDELESKNVVSVYPNPTIDRITIECMNEDIQEIALFDIDGKLLVTTPVIKDKRKQIVSLDKFANGMYFVRIKTETQIHTRKLALYK